jgi:hypothetical protein
MAYIGTSPSNGVRRRFVYEATASQTSFSGSDENGVTLTYVDSLYLDVFQNGIKLKAGDDYTATTGTSVVLVQGASANDVVEMVAFDVFSVGDTVSAKDGGSFAGNVAMAGTLGVTGVLTGTSLDISGDIDVDGTTNLDVVDIDGAVDMASGLTVAGNIVINSGIVRGERGTEAAPPFTFSDDLDTGMFNISNADLGFTVGGTERARIHANGVVSASAGVALGVGTANTASNVLDDYEEGTWTPSHGGNTSYTARTGTYVKVGQTVFIRGQVNINELGTGSNAAITGLPFTSATTVNGNPAGTLNVNYYSGLAIAVIHIAGYVTSNATTINTVANVTANATIEYNTGAFYQDDSRIDFSMTYETA